MSGKKAVLDTSIIIDGNTPELLESEGVEEVIVPGAVLDELQAQASKGREEGFIGLDELDKIKEECDRRGLSVRIVGDRPGLEDIRLANSGRIDALINDVANREGATLLTSDYVQSRVAKAQGVDAKFVPQKKEEPKLTFLDYFDEQTMSVHLKEGVAPMAKRGKPGKFKLMRLSEKPLEQSDLERMTREILDASRLRPDVFIEVDKPGAKVVQLDEYRIAVAKPPFSDGHELTVVRPVIKLRLEDYELSDKLLKRLEEKAEGLLVSGPPGSGKSTFVSSLADFYSSKNKITKTLEAPRDLQVDPVITQYGPLEGSFIDTADILLLVRPDYTIFDEVRKSEDFQVFSDMRLAGVGMVGVVHASDAIDAVQRFIGRLELGMLPSVLDTIIFIRYGEIAKVLTLELTVKVPAGMAEQDLARPVVEVRDFQSGDVEYEIYTYGEENVVIPVRDVEGAERPSALEELAGERVYEEFARYDKGNYVEFTGDDKCTVYVDDKVIPQVIGQGGKNISRLEDKLGLSIDVRSK